MRHQSGCVELPPRAGCGCKDGQEARIETELRLEHAEVKGLLRKLRGRDESARRSAALFLLAEMTVHNRKEEREFARLRAAGLGARTAEIEAQHVLLENLATDLVQSTRKGFAQIAEQLEAALLAHIDFECGTLVELRQLS